MNYCSNMFVANTDFLCKMSDLFLLCTLIQTMIVVFIAVKLVLGSLFISIAPILSMLVVALQ